MVETADTIDDRGPAVLAVTTALLVLSTIFIILRLISRIGVVKKVSTDDYFIVLAWVSPNSWPVANMDGPNLF